VRATIEAAIAARRTVLGSAELDARLRAETIDVTMPGRRSAGLLHPSLESMAEIARIFASSAS
jgi:phenylalanyl-tRNA synthetase alpha chain